MELILSHLQGFKLTTCREVILLLEASNDTCTTSCQATMECHVFVVVTAELTIAVFVFIDDLSFLVVIETRLFRLFSPSSEQALVLLV